MTRQLSLFHLSGSPPKSPILGACLYLPDAKLSLCEPHCKAFVEKSVTVVQHRGNQVVIPAGADKGVKRDNWGRRCPRELQTALPYFWESKRPGTCKDCVRGQEGLEKALISHSG